MKLAEFSVKQSLFINLLSIFLVIAGAFTLINMQREAFPNITFDIVTITTSYPGASPEEVEKLITTPLEKEVKKVDGIKEMVSSSRENSSLIYVEIDPDASDKDKVVNDVQRAVDRFNDLPDDANDPVVTEVTTKEMAILEVSLSGDLSEKKLQLYAESLEDRIEDIDGVAAVKRNGFREREIWVEVDPEKMREYYVSLEEVMAALKARNISISGGDLIEGSTEFNIRTTGEFYTAKEVADVIIRANDAGNWLRVKDVAVVKDGYKDENLIHKTRGTQAINLVVTKRESGDAISIVEDIDRVLDDFKKSAPAELQFSIVKDLSFYIKRRLNVLKRNAVIGVILVISSLLLFLNRRVAIMTTLGIPIAFLTTFAVMGYMGISINLISMFGLIIVLGMIVDDGIIISENVYRHMEEGLSPRQAAIVGTSEVMKPVFATIATTMAAFSSLFFMSGIMGRYVRNIPIVVIVALMASMMEAFIILPSHLADFVRPIKNKVGKIMSKKESPWFASILNSYTALLKGAMKNRYKVCLVVIAVFILCLGLVFSGVMRFSLFGSGGVEEFYVRAEAPVGTPLEVTSGMVSKIEDIITTLPPEYMDTFTTTVGRSGEDYGFDPYGRQGSNMAQIAVYLTPSQTRKREARDIMEDLRKTVEKAKMPGFEKVAFFIPEHGPPKGKAVAVRIRGERFEVLHEMAEKFVDYMSGIKGALDIDHDYRMGKDELRIVVDEEKAAAAYLTVGGIAANVRTAFKGGVATEIKQSKAEEEIDVLVRFPQERTNTLEIFDSLLIPNTYGKLIPLKKVAHIEKKDAISTIRHLDGKRVVTAMAGVDKKNMTSIKLNQMLAKKFKNIESDYVGYTVKYGGEQEETKESMESFARAFLLSFFLIFMILASNFRSLVQPLVVMLAIPFGFVGVVLAFIAHNMPLSFMALLGIVGLTGVVVNDSIVLVDFINRMRLGGADRRESIVKAGQLRLRPVLLTTITTCLGLAPVAYGIGGGDPFLRPAAMAISWGLVFATGLTLVIIPCIYAIIDDVTIKITHHTTVKMAKNGRKDGPAYVDDKKNST